MAGTEIIYTLTNGEYQAADGVSKSQLDLIHTAPALLEWRKNAPIDKAKLDTFNIGTAVHAAILEPNTFDDIFAVAPNVDRRTKKGKEEYAEFEAGSDGKTIISNGDHKKIMLMRDSALAHPQFKQIYDHGFTAEASLFWADDETGLKCKCRPDFMLLDQPLAIDIKSTAEIHRFARSIAEYRYHVQDAHYSAGLEKHYGESPDFLFLAVSSSISGGQYPVRLFKLNDEDRLQGVRERKADLDTYFQCQVTGEWNGLEMISLPAWAKDDLNTEV